MRKILFIIIAIVLTACSAVATEVPSALESARDKWQNANISHYRFNVNVSCFCAFTQEMPLIVEVQNGEVASLEYQSGNEIDPASLEFFQRFVTVDRLFEEIEKDQAGEADEVVVEYDETYGFPTTITIDFVEEATDDELYLTISEFEVLP